MSKTVEKKVYLDNAATTPLMPEVVAKMSETLANAYGNPSSTHQLGRASRALIEGVRKGIATHLNTEASTIIFTSGGTEANNMILSNAVHELGVTHIITSKIEHHAVGHVAAALEAEKGIKVSYVALDEMGRVVMRDLENILATHSEEKTLVSLMAFNNEIGNLLDLKEVGTLCRKYDALFHSDTVQAVGHYPLDLAEIPIDFICASAHKFHGAKGMGFAYVRKGLAMGSLILGGGQEKGKRAGTEDVAGIVGMGVALDHCLKNLDAHLDYVQSLKNHCITALQAKVAGVKFNGCIEAGKSSPFVLNVKLPQSKPMLIFQLDMKGVMVSGGSACQSGSNKGSHVLAALPKSEQPSTDIRVSFSKLNTLADIDYFVDCVKELLA